MSTQSSSQKIGAGNGDGAEGGGEQMSGLAGRLAFAWAFVGIPLAYGIFETAKKAAALFTG